MKSIIFLVTVLLISSFVSCKKIRDCECTSNNGGNSYNVSSTVKMTKKEATTWCEGSNNTSSATYNCKLK